MGSSGIQCHAVFLPEKTFSMTHHHLRISHLGESESPPTQQPNTISKGTRAESSESTGLPMENSTNNQRLHSGVRVFGLLDEASRGRKVADGLVRSTR